MQLIVWEYFEGSYREYLIYQYKLFYVTKKKNNIYYFLQKKNLREKKKVLQKTRHFFRHFFRHQKHKDMTLKYKYNII